MVFYKLFYMKTLNVSRPVSKPFTQHQENVNTIIHAFGVLFGLVAIPFLLSTAAEHTNVNILMRVSVYGISFLATFIFSTVYHGLRNEKRKLLFEKFDRISIYFFIAGTYTPFVMFYMDYEVGSVLLGTIWTFVLLGIIYELFLVNRFFLLSIFFYVLMGFMFAFVSKQFFAAMPNYVITLILSGIVLYSIGIIFFVWQKWKYHHAIWHTFVLAASICHYLAVLETVQ